jgi:predicted MFS family arabinose efflux permease
MGGRLSTATGTVLGAWPLGIALALALLGGVAQAAGWRAALAVAGGYAALALLAAWRLERVFAATAPAGWDSGARVAAAATQGAAADAGPRLAGLGPAVAISVSWMVLNVGYTAFIAFAPTWLTSAGWSLEAAGFAVSLSGWALVAMQPWGGWLADRLGRPSLVLAIGCLVAGAAIALALATGGAVPLFLLAGVAMGFTPGVMGAQLALSAPPAKRAVAFGFFATGSGAGSMLGPSLAGVAVDLTGTAQAAIAMAAALVVAALLPWWWSQRARRRRRDR